MGIVDEFFIHTFSSRREVTTPTGNTTYINVLTGIPCLLTALDAESQSYVSGVFGRGYSLYTYQGQDVFEGDIVTVDEDDYLVKAVDDMIPDMFEGFDAHSRYIVVKQNRRT